MAPSPRLAMEGGGPPRRRDAEGGPRHVGVAKQVNIGRKLEVASGRREEQPLEWGRAKLKTRRANPHPAREV